MEPVCPLDFRYGRNEMKEVLNHRARVQRCLDVEAALARAQAAVGDIPKAAAKEITRKASLKHVSMERIEEIERSVRHDIMAMVRVLSDECGKDAGKYVHLGATSYDIVDTALALQMRDALDILEGSLDSLIMALSDKAGRYRDLVMVGRTHGQYAVPITLGLKLAVWVAELRRHKRRLKEMRPRLLVGKMSGAVGTGAALGEHAFEIEGLVMKDLGLGAEEAATQIVQRDRMIELFCNLSNLSVTIEKMATEVRTLQRSEIGEVSEPFDESRQVGSSTMSHKRNPITCENITGLSRTLRGFLIPEFESGIQWSERDLSNSSTERFVLPHMLILADDIVSKMTDVISGLVVSQERIERNLEEAGEVIMAESVIMLLCGKGMGRQEAHEVTRKAAMEYYSGKPYRQVLLRERSVKELITEEELDSALDPKNYIGKAAERVDRILKSRSP